jgi:AraC family transcriptional regulator of adaptative response / DNA-3-methyladenine glycosylase II
MRALRDPDAFMPTDLGIRRAAVALGLPDDPAHLTQLTEHWRPWRSYAMAHLWSMPAAGAPMSPSVLSRTPPKPARGSHAA